MYNKINYYKRGWKMLNERIKKTMSNFSNNGIKCTYLESSTDAKEYILSNIGKDDTVGFGGSVTLFEMGIHNDLIKRGNSVYWHWLEETPEGRKNAILKSRDANFYLTSSNAITEDGEIVNVDGTGNRVATMIFGPKKTIIVCGINKLSENLVEALDRVRKNAAPPNSKRLNRKTPCCKTGECHDCDSPERICNVTTIIHKKPGNIDLELLLINENLGY